MDVAAQSYLERPFAPPCVEPIVHVLNLPLPPSVNKAWNINVAAQRKMYRAPRYVTWVREAGLTLMADGKLRERQMIAGKFTAIIEIRRDWTAIEPNKFDLDNRVKALLDFCQEYRFIKNDSELEEYTVRWTATAAPRGCRITLRALA